MTTLYKTGAISIGAGSTNVTGSGTAWTTSGTRPGDLLIAGGAVAEIASVTSANGITLANAWPGATQAAVNYAILQLDDGLRALIAANTLLQALDGGTLTSLADLPGAANTLPYFTGEHVMGLANFGAAARAFLAAGPVVTTSQSDVEIGRLLKVGDFGLGFGAYYTDEDDFDDLPTGFFGNSSATAVPANEPFPTQAYAGFRADASSLRAFELAARLTGNGDVYWRRKDTSWRPWAKAFDTLNILGAVSQSGGVPTGAIIERGNNGNGEYVRFADGTQMCWHTLSFGDITTVEGSLFRPASDVFWTFPAAFAARPDVKADVRTAVSEFATAFCNSTTTATLRAYRPTPATGAKEYGAFAIGRWF